MISFSEKRPGRQISQRKERKKEMYISVNQVLYKGIYKLNSKSVCFHLLEMGKENFTEVVNAAQMKHLRKSKLELANV